MDFKLISKANLLNLLGELQEEYSVILPVRKGETRFYEPFLSLQSKGETGEGTNRTPIDNHFVIGEVRAFEPLKSFYFQAKQRVAENFQDIAPKRNAKALCIVGAKACDLKGFKVLDTVFMGDDYLDPFYKKAREENLIISADCTSALDVCFCLSLDVDPYPKENFDINLSEIADGYVVQAGSDIGTGLLERYSGYFQEPNKDHLKQRDIQRGKVADKVRENIRSNSVPDQNRLSGVIEKNYEDPLWKEEAETCVECGACNTICPTCHCFLLLDQQDNRDLVRFRLWDSCLIKDFAKVAGGANPRPQLWMRLRNRFEKKFDYFPKVNDLYACTGCGRCILACPGKIDIRKVLKRNVENVQK
jgi:NAD-dependent dihydropyrimidine dehydrogenase PreA subunit